MKERRYKKEYRTVLKIDPKTGRERAEAEYIGAYYRFEGDPARARALRLMPWAGLFWAALLVYLKTARATGRFMAALVPALVALLPGFYMALGLVSLLRAPEKLTVVDLENGPGRLVRASLGCGVFTAVSAAGAAVCLFMNRAWPAAWHEALLPALACAAAWMAFVRARRDFREARK